MKHSISGASTSSMERWYRYVVMISLLISLSFHNVLISQVDPCANPILICDDQINLSIAEGIITIEPFLISEGIPFTCLGEYTVNITQNGVSIGAQINCSFSEQLLDYTLVHTPSGLSCSGQLLIEDKSGPTIICEDIDIPCSADSSPASIGNPMVTDNCDGNPLLTSFDTYIDFNCANSDFLGSIQRQWTATDNQGNTSQCTQVINILRPSLADIVFPGDITIDCTDGNTDSSNTGTPVIATLPSSTTCNIIVDFEDTETIVCSSTKRIIRRWTVIDWCTNQQIENTQRIDVADNMGPILSCPDSLQFGAADDMCSATITFPNINAGDACGTIDSINASWEFGSGFGPFTEIPVGQYTMTYTAVDDCGNLSACIVPVSIIDNVIPVAICDLTTTVGIGEDQISMICADDIDSGSFDNCELIRKEIRLVGDENFSECISLTCDQVGSILMVELQVTDHNELQNHCTVEVNVFDKIAPVIENCAADITINCDADPNNLSATGLPIVTDNCSTDIDFTDAIDLNACNVGNIIRTFVVADDSGNTSTCTQLITLADTTAPVITFSEDITLVCQSINDEIGKPTVEDNCGQFAFFFEDHILEDSDCLQRFDRRWEVLNICTKVVASQNLKITLENDTNLPIFSGAPVLITISCSDPIPNFIAPQVTDLCDTDVQIATATVGDTNDCPSIRNIIRIYTATDDCGNSNTFTQTIRLIDNEAPTFINFPADQTISCEDSATDDLPAITDNCDDAPTITFTDQSVPGDCQNEEFIFRTYVASDRCGNATSGVQIFHFVDTVPPIIRGQTNDFSISCEFPIPVFDLGAIDNCDDDLDIDIVDISVAGDCPNEEIITRINSVTDDCGNQILDTIIITVFDNTAPELIATNLVSNLNISCEQDLPIINFVITDNCDNDIAIVESRDTVGDACNFNITRTFTATDDCGNAQVATQMVSVSDDQAPIFFVFPQNQDVTIFNGESIQVDVIDAVVSDNCTENLEINFEIDFFSDGDQPAAPNQVVIGANASGVYPLGIHTITFNAVDACDNILQQNLLISVFDFTPSSACNSITLEIGENSLLAVGPAQVLEDPGVLSQDDLTINFVNPSNFTQVIGSQLILDCTNLGLNQYAIEITTPDGNSTICSNMIVLIDPDARCGVRSDEASVAGKIFNIHGEAVIDVDVQLRNDNELATGTDRFGLYQFDALPMGSSCEIIPENDQNHSLGISTFDMVLMQSHILQVKKLTNPYQHIAADVDQSGAIDILDLLEMRSLILFQTQRFTASPSYRFIEASHQFSNPNNPLAEEIPSVHICQNIEQSQADIDFISIKIGDIDGASFNFQNKNVLSQRSESVFTLQYEDVLLPAGQLSTINISGTLHPDIVALQFGLSISNAQIINVEYPDKLQSNIHVDRQDIHFAWTSFDKVLSSDILRLNIIPDTDIMASQILSIHTKENALAYNNQGQATYIPLEYLSITKNEQSNFLGQNIPNPFNRITDIPFQLNQGGMTVIQIKNLEGKIVHSHSQFYTEGWHSYQYSHNDLAPGIYVYSLTQNSTTQIKKMVITK